MPLDEKALGPLPGLIERRDSMLYVAALVSIGTVASLTMSVSPLIVDGLVTSAGLTLSQAGYITSVETAAICLGTIVSIVLANKHSPRMLIGVGLLFMVLGNVLSTKAAGFLGFAGVRAATGFGCGLTMIFTGLLAQTVRPQRNYAIYMGVNVVAVAGIGAAIPALMASQGVAGVYAAIAATGVGCLASLGVLPSIATAKAALEDDVASKSQIFWLQGWVAAACSMEFLFTFSLAIIWTYMVAFGMRSGVGETQTSFAISISWLLLGTTGSIAAGLLDGRIRSRTLIWALSLAFVANTALLWYGKQPVLFYASVGAFIFIWSIIIPPILNILAELDGSGRLATSGMLLQTMGFSAGPAIGAVILQNYTLGVVAAVAASGFIGLILVLRLVVQPGHPARLVGFAVESSGILEE